MVRAEIDWGECRGCQPCLARQACKPRAILKLAADELAYIDSDRCRGCGVCVPACSYAAIRVVSPLPMMKPVPMVNPVPRKKQETI